MVSVRRDTWTQAGVPPTGTRDETVTISRNPDSSIQFVREQPPGSVVENRLANADEASQLTGLEGLRARQARGAEVSHSAVQSVPTTPGSLFLTYDTEAFDDQGQFHHLVTNPTRLTVPVDGRYGLLGIAPWAGAAGGFRRAGFLLNGAVVLSFVQMSPGSADPLRQVATDLVDLVAGDFVEFGVQQSTGTPLDIQAGATFKVERIST